MQLAATLFTGTPFIFHKSKPLPCLSIRIIEYTVSASEEPPTRLRKEVFQERNLLTLQVLARWSRVWLAAIVTNTSLQLFFSSLTLHLHPCMLVSYMYLCGGHWLRGFIFESCRVQNALMDPNKTLFCVKPWRLRTEKHFGGLYADL